MEKTEKLHVNSDWLAQLQAGWTIWRRQSRHFLLPELAVDLGTAQTRVYIPGEGVVFETPSIIALESGTQRIVAVGDEAKALNGREPAGIQVVETVKDGVIENDQAAAALLRYCLSRVLNRRFTVGLRLLLSKPSDITPLEEKAMREAARVAGATQVTLLEEAVAAALGAEIGAERTRASVVVDIGAGTTDIAVVSRGEMVQGGTLRQGSRAMDQAILRYLRQARGIETGAENAERIKLTLATLKPDAAPAQLEIRGRNLNTRLPEFFTITSAEVCQAIAPVIHNLTNFIRATLEDLPLKAALDLLDTGVVLSGGGALLPGLADWLADELKLGVWLSDDPLRATLYGLGRLLEEPEAAASDKYLIQHFKHLELAPRQSAELPARQVQVSAINDQ
jgi:rod shape-determining protein MreB